MDGTGAVQTMIFLGQTVGYTCLATILGIGKSRLKKAMSSVPDLRFGKQKNLSRKDTWSVDSFLSLQYQNVAETLPDRCAVKKCHDDYDVIMLWWCYVMLWCYVIILNGFFALSTFPC